MSSPMALVVPGGAGDIPVVNSVTTVIHAMGLVSLVPPFERCDLDQNGSTSIVDVQQCVIQAINIAACTNGDINLDALCNVVDVQRVVNNALGVVPASVPDR